MLVSYIHSELTDLAGKERLAEYLKISASAAKGVMDSFLRKCI